MKGGGALVLRPSYRELKAAFEARRAHLLKPDGINQLYQADFTRLNIPGYPARYLLLVMDYFSRYLLVLRLYPGRTAEVLIEGLEDALEEAMRMTSLKADQIITLVTGDGPAMMARRTARYVDMSPFYHIRGRRHHPQTTGMVERLIRIIKEEAIYPNHYTDPVDAQAKLDKFRFTYNQVRPHQALNYKTPFGVYIGDAGKAAPDSVKKGP
jgi:putative transposase